MKKTVVLLLCIVFVLPAILASCGDSKVKDFDKEVTEYLNSQRFADLLIEKISADYVKCDEVKVNVQGGIEPTKSGDKLTSTYMGSASASGNGFARGFYSFECKVYFNEKTGEVGVVNGTDGIKLIA